MDISLMSAVPNAVQAHMEKTCFVLAYLTSQGRVPLLGLNDVIAGVLRGWPSRRVGWLLLQVFYQCRLATNPNTGEARNKSTFGAGELLMLRSCHRMEWLLELMGHIRNVAYGATPVTCGDTKRATDFLFQVFAAAVVSWGDHRMPRLLGIRDKWFPWQPGSKPQIMQHGLYGGEAFADHALPQCMLGMAHSLAQLLDREPWGSQTHKRPCWPSSPPLSSRRKLCGPEHTDGSPEEQRQTVTMAIQTEVLPQKHGWSLNTKRLRLSGLCVPNAGTPLNSQNRQVEHQDDGEAKVCWCCWLNIRQGLRVHSMAVEGVSMTHSSSCGYLSPHGTQQNVNRSHYGTGSEVGLKDVNPYRRRSRMFHKKNCAHTTGLLWISSSMMTMVSRRFFSMT
ncbi:hypothetical protein FQN60_017487 [Etheostoma spectabile]|uniref:Focadhesin C-terminal domain-containing protein n=1 Tax=Etheostoma spectabile TaxID=54343 RepID=A0A5J5CG19_9PERO|nr:hypothetical protein FQN60_017487 [Etheostoma spectabile]